MEACKQGVGRSTLIYHPGNSQGKRGCRCFSKRQRSRAWRGRPLLEFACLYCTVGPPSQRWAAAVLLAGPWVACSMKIAMTVVCSACLAEQWHLHAAVLSNACYGSCRGRVDGPAGAPAAAIALCMGQLWMQALWESHLQQHVTAHTQKLKQQGWGMGFAPAGPSISSGLGVIRLFDVLPLAPAVVRNMAALSSGSGLIRHMCLQQVPQIPTLACFAAARACRLHCTAARAYLKPSRTAICGSTSLQCLGVTAAT